MPPIVGVCQAAMVLKDAPLRDMSLEQMKGALAPKVEGSIYLNELFQENTLDFFIFFSSLARVLGNYGQSNYSAANSFMTSLAAQRRRQGLAASSIDIGALLGVGYITRNPEQIKLIQEKNASYAWISEQIFRTAFAEAIIAGRPGSHDAAEIITGITKIKPTAYGLLALFKNPIFSQYIIEESVLGQDNIVTTASASLKDQLQQVSCSDDLFSLVAGKSPRS